MAESSSWRWPLSPPLTLLRFNVSKLVQQKDGALIPVERNAAAALSPTSFCWLLTLSLALLLPQLAQMPPLLLAVCAAALTIRSLWWRRRPDAVPLWLRLPLLLSGLAAIYATYAGVVGVEPAVALLLLSFAGKWLELNSRRDGQVLILLGCFVMLAQFLFDQSLLMAGYALFELLLIVTSWLVLLHGQQPMRALGWAARLLGQSLPLMVALFLLFPRIGPLWSIPLSSSTARSGFAEEIGPGDISRLRLTDELVLRARFEGEIPPAAELFWRGLVLAHFDGRNWRQESLQSADAPMASSGQGVPYELVMEPTGKRWIFALDHSSSGDSTIRKLTDGRLQSSTPISERRRFALRRQTDTAPATLSVQQRQRYLQLPARGNPRSRKLAEQWRAQNPAAEAVVRQVLDHFHDQPFHYTLEAPLLGDQPIDQFLFETRSGYCEHYASALTFLLRAAGLPARIVAGYHGGELNPIDRYLIVRQSDAHAWVEVWSDLAMTWLRVDPTAAIAPERVSQSAVRAALAGEPLTAAVPEAGWRPAAWLHWLQLFRDAAEYRWHRTVLSYDLSRQQQWLGQWFEGVDGVTLARAALLVLLLAMLLPLFWLLPGRNGPHLDPADRSYQRFCRRLTSAGLARQPGEPPADYARRLVLMRPDLAAEVNRISRAYMVLRYGQPTARRAARLDRVLRGAVRRFRV